MTSGKIRKYRSRDQIPLVGGDIPQMEKRRVVVTGMGAVTPLGIGVEPSWQALLEGRSGVGPVTAFDASSFKCQVIGEVKGFDAEDWVDRKIARRTDRFIHFALAAAQMAMDDSGLSITSDISDRVGAVVASAAAGMLMFEENHKLLLEGRVSQISPFFLAGFIANMAAGQIAIRYGAKGPNSCPVTACAAATHALGDAFKIIQRGDAEAIIAGGSEAAMGPTIFAALDSTRAATTKRNHEPQKASRPFDKDRDGFVPAEGAGILILEELEFAQRRGARIYGEIVGYGLSCDAYHITTTSPDGDGAARCMTMALRDAGLDPSEVDYINAHGTSTVVNDISETMAIKKVFGEGARKLVVSSNKSIMGHLWGASGAVEAIFSLLTINRGIVPATINHEDPDPQCDLDYVPNKSREMPVRVVLSNSFGFGGTNAVIALKEFVA
jgi:3-oxoacyl-[acyl-carrier-protein] synthase II